MQIICSIVHFQLQFHYIIEPSLTLFVHPFANNIHSETCYITHQGKKKLNEILLSGFCKPLIFPIKTDSETEARNNKSIQRKKASETNLVLQQL